jgi:hypothetical protein
MSPVSTNIKMQQNNTPFIIISAVIAGFPVHGRPQNTEQLTHPVEKK